MMDERMQQRVELEETLLGPWNARVVDYDCERFPFHEWIRDRINHMGWPVEDMRYLHEVIPSEQVYKVSKQLCADTNLPEFRAMVNTFIREEIAPKGELQWPIAVQRFWRQKIESKISVFAGTPSQNPVSGRPASPARTRPCLDASTNRLRPPPPPKGRRRCSPSRSRRSVSLAHTFGIGRTTPSLQPRWRQRPDGGCYAPR